MVWLLVLLFDASSTKVGQFVGLDIAKLVLAPKMFEMLAKK